MSTNWLAEQISNVLGLGTQDVKEQIIPYVETLSTRIQVERHLQELCGASPFIKVYLDRRFPLRQTPPAAPPSNPSSSKVSGPTPSQAFPSIKPKQKKNNPKLPAPPSARPVSQNPSVPTPEDLAGAFGGAAGQVYIKGREEDLGWGGGGKKKGSRPGTGSTTPAIGLNGNGNDGHGSSSMNPSRSGSPALPASIHNVVNTTSGSRNPSIQGKPRKAEEPEKPKSREMKKIERMIEGVKKMGEGNAAEAGKMDGQEGCFCLARTHPLSPYTPSCPQCGLILCNLHLPYHPCPHCEAALLGASGIMRVITKLNDELGVVLRREDEERRRAVEEERAAYLAATGGGAFPSLSMASGGVVKDVPTKIDSGRKVMTIANSSATPATAAQRVKGGRNLARGPKATVIITRASAAQPAASQTLENLGVKETMDDDLAGGRGRGKVHRTPRPIENDSDAGAKRYRDLQDRRKFNEMWRAQEGRKFGDRIAVLQGWDAQYEPLTQEEKEEMEERIQVESGKGRDKENVSNERTVVPGAEVKTKSKNKGKGKGNAPGGETVQP